MVSATQKAVIAPQACDADGLQILTDYPTPQRGPGQVLVAQKSTSVNPVDTYVRSGTYKPQYPKCLGGDVAGIVEEADPNSKFKPGDKVFALTKGYSPETQQGTYCRYVSVPEQDVAALPASLPIEEAGAVPLVALTAWQALEPLLAQTAESHENLPQRRVLVTAAAGGVGPYAVQIAKSRGAYVVGTAGADNQAFLKELGCDECVNYREQDVADLYSGPDKQFDVVVDMVGGKTIDSLTRVLKQQGGTYSHIMNRGTDQEKMDKVKEAFHVHTVLVQPNGQQLFEIASLINQGKIKVVIAATYPLEKAADAHKQVETWHTRGKVVLTI